MLIGGRGILDYCNLVIVVTATQIHPNDDLVRLNPPASRQPKILKNLHCLLRSGAVSAFGRLRLNLYGLRGKAPMR